jgi:hypothetical protein
MKNNSQAVAVASGLAGWLPLVPSSAPRVLAYHGRFDRDLSL